MYPARMAVQKHEITLKVLSAEAFAPFGTVIQNPAPSLRPGQLQHASKVPANAKDANQGTAIKYVDITKMTDDYRSTTLSTSGSAVMNMFTCAPRTLRPVESGGSTTSCLDIQILERHPYTFQTFVPLGLSPTDRDTYYIVVVAPTLTSEGAARSQASSGESASTGPDWQKLSQIWDLHGKHASQHALPRPPDVPRAQAFLARGDQAITYAAGTWHAPMVVIGKRAVDFVVTQFVNGVADDDCQEVFLESADELGVHVAIPPDTSTVVSSRNTLSPKL